MIRGSVRRGQLVSRTLQANPVTTVAKLREASGLTTPTINSLFRELESRGIVRESTGRARDRPDEQLLGEDLATVDARVKQADATDHAD